MNKPTESQVKEAVERLRDMQRQIIHGKNTFGDIADAIEAQSAALKAEKERLDWLEKLGHQEWIELANKLGPRSGGAFRSAIDSLRNQKNKR